MFPIMLYSARPHTSPYDQLINHQRVFESPQKIPAQSLVLGVARSHRLVGTEPQLVTAALAIAPLPARIRSPYLIGIRVSIHLPAWLTDGNSILSAINQSFQ